MRKLFESLFPSDLLKIERDFLTQLSPLLTQHNFQEDDTHKHGNTGIIRKFKRGEQFVSMSIFNNRMYHVFSDEPLKDNRILSDWALNISIGEGEFGFYAERWNALYIRDYKHFLANRGFVSGFETEMPYTFHKIQMRQEVISTILSDLEEVANEFLKGNLSGFYQTRNKIAQQQPLIRKETYDPKTGIKTHSVDEEDLYFKEKYSLEAND